MIVTLSKFPCFKCIGERIDAAAQKQGAFIRAGFKKRIFAKSRVFQANRGTDVQEGLAIAKNPFEVIAWRQFLFPSAMFLKSGHAFEGVNPVCGRAIRFAANGNQDFQYRIVEVLQVRQNAKRSYVRQFLGRHAVGNVHFAGAWHWRFVKCPFVTYLKGVCGFEIPRWVCAHCEGRYHQKPGKQGNSFHLKSFSVVKVVTAVMRRVIKMSSAVVLFKHLGGAAVAALSSYRWGRGGPVYVPPNLPVELRRVACAVRPTFLLGGYCV